MTTRFAETADDRIAEVWSRLHVVTDPELDEPVTELGFITNVEVFADGAVRVAFRLPTYWCAVNFAFLMADDMRRAVSSLPWVTEVGVRLGEHMYSHAINQGLRLGQAFEETFSLETTQGLDEIRHTFAVKAFQRRQEALLRLLLAAGHASGDLLNLTIGALTALPLSAEGRKSVDRYLWRRGVVGCAENGHLAFVDKDGAAIERDDFPRYMAQLRLVRVNMEANGSMCRGLLAARFGTDELPMYRDDRYNRFGRPKNGPIRA